MSKSSVSYYIIIFLICILAFQVSAYGILGEVYTYLRVIIQALVIILFFYVLDLSKIIMCYRNVSLFRVHSLGLLFLVSILSLLTLCNVDIEYSPASDLALSLTVLIVGININLTEKRFARLVKLYVVFNLLAALSIVFVFANGFEIQEQYLPVPKNQIAPVIGTAFIVSTYFSLYKNKISNKYYFLFSLVLFVSLLIVRGRAAIVSVVVSSIIFLLVYLRSGKYRFIIISVTVAMLPFIWQYFIDAMFLNYDVSDMDSVSTGRLERNIAGFNFFQDHILFGALEERYVGEKIHNYILVNLVTYGTLLSSIILYIYSMYVTEVVRSIRKNTYKYYEVGPLVMFALIVISIFEYTYPYAPGSATCFPFFLMGQYLKQQYQQNSNIVVLNS